MSDVSNSYRKEVRELLIKRIANARQKFLDGHVTFSGIWRLVESVMGKHKVNAKPDLNDIIEADGWARQAAEA